MFRRKGEEEGLFDTTTIAKPASEPAAATAPTTANSSTGSSSSSASGSTGSGSTTSSTGGSQAAAGRSLSESRPASPSAPSFRPNANPLGDMGRNRLPDTKPGAATSANADKSKSGRRVLTVGNDILLKGEIATCDRLVIEGKVDATLNEVHTVEIAENGSFKGAANIEDAEISGLFEGELVVRNRLIIYATGKVRGKISYGEIEIERGGELTGEIKMGSAQSGAARPARPTSGKEDKFAA